MGLPDIAVTLQRTRDRQNSDTTLCYGTLYHEAERARAKTRVKLH